MSESKDNALVTKAPIETPESIKSSRFDVEYKGNGASLDYHFCREWDEDGGCYGTNENHGLSFEDACEEIAQWHEQQAKAFRDRSHHLLSSFLTPQDVADDFF